MSNYFNRFSKRKEEIEFLYQELYSDSSSLAELEKEIEVFSIVRSDELKELDSKREDTLWYLNNNVLALT
ncbi:MAG: amylosucrase, partial [Spirochaetales bacterium]|nr:amylosucrase [Spirochaetales bacterium]